LRPADGCSRSKSKRLKVLERVERLQASRANERSGSSWTAARRMHVVTLSTVMYCDHVGTRSDLGTFFFLPILATLTIVVRPTGAALQHHPRHSSLQQHRRRTHYVNVLANCMSRWSVGIQKQEAMRTCAQCAPTFYHITGRPIKPASRDASKGRVAGSRVAQRCWCSGMSSCSPRGRFHHNIVRVKVPGHSVSAMSGRQPSHIDPTSPRFRLGDGANAQPGDKVVVHWAGFTKGYQGKSA
jgi:hypothetical protein